MRKVEDSGARIVYRRGARSVWWLAIAILLGMVLLYLLGGRNVFTYLLIAPLAAIAFFTASSDERIVIDTHARAIESFEIFFWRSTRTETIAFSRVTRVTILPNYSRHPGERRLERDGFAIGIDWTTASGEGGVRLESFHEDAAVMAEAEKLARVLGTRVERVQS